MLKQCCAFCILFRGLISFNDVLHVCLFVCRARFLKVDDLPGFD